MTRWQKLFALLAVLMTVPLLSTGAVSAQDAAGEPRIERLLGELAEPDRPDWEQIEAEIIRLWTRSGSDAMDLLLRRGNEAMEAENYELALEHFGALTDHAPAFAEGWNARATAYFLLGEYALAMADIERALALNPNHFGALSGLGYIFDRTGDPAMALKALRAAEALNPNREDLQRTIARLEQQMGVTDL